MPSQSDVKIRISAQDKTKQAFQSVNSRLAGIRKASIFVARGMTALAGAISAGSVGMGEFAKRATEAQKPLIDMADLLGVTASSLSEMAIAGELAGVGTNQLTVGLQRQARRIAEAAQNTGEAVKALKELGLEAKELNRLSPDKQFERIAAAMSSISNRGDQIRLSMKLWDSEGVKLLNTIGKLGLAQQIALETGAVLTQKETEAFNQMADAIVRTEGAYKSFQQSVVNSGAGPAIENLKQTSIGLLETWIKLAATGSIWDAIQSGALRLLGMSEQADKVLTGILDRFEEFDGRIKSLVNDQAPPSNNGIETAIKNIGVAADESQKAVKAFKTETETFDDLLFSKVDAEFKALDNEMADGFLGLNVATEQIKEVEVETKRASDAARDLGLTMSSAFEEAVIEGQGLQEVLKGILKDIAQIFLRETVTNPLAGAVTTFAGQYFAGGTDFAPGGLAMVGEKGPEIVNLPRGSQVIPNHEIGGMGGFTIQNIDARGSTDPMETERAVRRAVEQSVDAIRDMKMRGALPEFA